MDVILVDESDNQVGVMEKLEAHKRGVLHRAITVYVFNTAGELLLQRRASTKYHCGGLWSNTCCGHPQPGETTENAARRRLQEEMGIGCELRFQFNFQYRLTLPGGMTENEYGHIYFGVSDECPVLNPEEADNFGYQTLAEVEKDIAVRPGRYTPWFTLVFPLIRRHPCTFPE